MPIRPPTLRTLSHAGAVAILGALTGALLGFLVAALRWPAHLEGFLEPGGSRIVEALLGRAPALGACAGALAALGSVRLLRDPSGVVGWGRGRGLWTAALAASSFASAFLFASPLARWLAVLVLSCAVALAAAALAPKTVLRVAPWVDRVVGAALFCFAAAVYLLYSWTRHARFGSGSWDLGCYAQSAWLAGRDWPMLSSLLDGRDVLSDHFMPIVWLLAPLVRIWPDAAALLALQAVAVASAAFPLLWLARREGLGLLASASIALAFLFALGTQSAVEFDFHHVAVGAACYAFAYWFLETGRTGPALACLALLVATREDAWLQAASLGLYAAIFQRRRALGAAVFVAGLAGFAAVVEWAMPALAGSREGVAHLARFEQFGATPLEAFTAALNPLRTLSIGLTPELKVHSALAVLCGFAALPLLSPRHLLLAAPLLAERFLSTKQEMWGTGFHYGLMLTLVGAIAATRGAPRAGPLLQGAWARITAGGPARSEPFVAWLVVSSALLVCAWGVPGAPSDFFALEKPYFSTHRAANRRALASVPEGASVAAQNHFLPHLALRREAYFLGEARRAQWVVANPDDGAWPYSREQVARLLRELLADGWIPVFSEETAVVLRRGGGTAVPVSGALSAALYGEPSPDSR